MLGVRNLTQGFHWSSNEVRSLAFLLYEAGALTVDEAAWLAGYCGAGAPMSLQSPLALEAENRSPVRFRKRTAC